MMLCFHSASACGSVTAHVHVRTAVCQTTKSTCQGMKQQGEDLQECTEAQLPAALSGSVVWFSQELAWN